jgi:hypothetical protein
VNFDKMIKKKPLLIAVSGVARSGKDTLALCIKRDLEERGLKAEIKSLAAPLKSALRKFVEDHFSIDIHNCSDAEKSVIRPMMLAFGYAKRQLTKGKYFTDEIDRILESSAADAIIVPDVRYADFQDDELQWVFSNNGVLFHVSKVLKNGRILEAPNEDEKRNDPKLKDAAEYEIIWPDGLSLGECYDFFKKELNIENYGYIEQN